MLNEKEIRIKELILLKEKYYKMFEAALDAQIRASMEMDFICDKMYDISLELEEVYNSSIS